MFLGGHRRKSVSDLLREVVANWLDGKTPPQPEEDYNSNVCVMKLPFVQVHLTVVQPYQKLIQLTLHETLYKVSNVKHH